MSSFQRSKFFCGVPQCARLLIKRFRTLRQLDAKMELLKSLTFFSAELSALCQSTATL
jgi:hypothetical protein